MIDQTNNPMGYPTTPYARDPRAQYLLQELQGLGGQPQRSAPQVGANLLADALFQYALTRQQRYDDGLGVAPPVGGGAAGAPAPQAPTAG
ncbi:MAG TPA: hypothetical protein VKU90_08175 [Caulobacteraceae bacterium]|nr:hypothetical protein [Caulobacteraceae bacterium]